MKGNTKFNDDFSKEIFEQTYMYEGEKDINDRHLAIAKDLASVEKDKDYWTQKFVSILEDFKFSPGGRITSNAGTGLKGTTYINCFVSGFRGKDQDSMDGIMDELRRQAKILKSEGGYGFCADTLRPRGGFIRGIGSDSPGAVKMLEMWDTQSGVITAGSGMKRLDGRGKKKIRKGAQMVTLSIWHPDIEEFITAKQTPGRLTKFNMSVLITDKFMEAVQNKKEWHLEFPDYEAHPKEYKETWVGNLEDWKSRGLKTTILKTFDDANELWDLIMTSTYNRNEPGVLFVDTINKMNNLYYCEHINATNPCGEQVLPVGGSCLLGSLNLTQFVDTKNKTWDYKKLEEVIPVAVRLMDNVNDKSNVPLPEQKEQLLAKRRIGLGYMGYGSALIMMKVRYGSKKALQLTEELCDFVMNRAYQASAHLAKEKGVFPAYEKEKYTKGNFFKGLSNKTKSLIKANGLRNSHLLSIQPTGNSSVMANNCSGGLEPVFFSEYIRTAIQQVSPDGLGTPVSVDWVNKKYGVKGGDTEWEWAQEGDEDILIATFNGDKYKFDKSRGLLKESRVRDYSVRFHEANGTWDSSAKWAATAFDLNIDDHVKTMKVFSKYVDAAMSKTVNLPANYPYEDFKKLYTDVYKTGTIKGATSYREGTMTAVLATQSTEKKKEKGIPKTIAPRRPKALDCDIHQLTVAGEKWIVLVGLMEKEPYEVFALKQKKLSIPPRIKNGVLTKVKGGQYDLETEDEWTISNIKDFFENSEQEALTRLISTSLRHGANVEFITVQLQKSHGTIVSFSKAIARTLKKYIKDIKTMKCSDCGSKNLKMQEGCYVCIDCGSSKCE